MLRSSPNPRWSEATEAFWRETLDHCRNRGQILAVGAGLPLRTRNSMDYPQKLSDLKLYDFSSAMAALKRMDITFPHEAQSKPGPEPIDNTMVVLGAEWSGLSHQCHKVAMKWRRWLRRTCETQGRQWATSLWRDAPDGFGYENLPACDPARSSSFHVMPWTQGAAFPGRSSRPRADRP
jgi:hypothetical protein